MEAMRRKQPAGLAKGSVDQGASAKKEQLNPEDGSEGKTDGDREVAARLASSLSPETMLNGTEGDDIRHKSPSHDSATGRRTVPLVNENGTSAAEPPHGSVTGSNGLVLTKHDSSSVSTPGLGGAPHRTNWLPLGSPSGEHAIKPLLASVESAQSSGALRTDLSTETRSGQGTADIKNGTASPPLSAPGTITVHRARKTMSRPAVSPAQKLLNRELREAKSVKMEQTKTHAPDTEKSLQQYSTRNHLPQGQ
ncbi:uncharacterized protein, partial [Brachionichthys hirsutus]|uniref:uncharacterized protein n=1 Tax=Brachionichthys hirsutus TaxID=412623 RepID=UPI0036044B49